MNQNFFEEIYIRLNIVFRLHKVKILQQIQRLLLLEVPWELRVVWILIRHFWDNCVLSCLPFIHRIYRILKVWLKSVRWFFSNLQKVISTLIFRIFIEKLLRVGSVLLAQSRVKIILTERITVFRMSVHHRNTIRFWLLTIFQRFCYHLWALNLIDFIDRLKSFKG